MQTPRATKLLGDLNEYRLPQMEMCTENRDKWTCVVRPPTGPEDPGAKCLLGEAHEVPEQARQYNTLIRGHS